MKWTIPVYVTLEADTEEEAVMTIHNALEIERLFLSGAKTDKDREKTTAKITTWRIRLSIRHEV